MTAYYNENDPFCAGWLRNLAAAGHIAPGDVDERDIRDVSPDDLKGYGQCHFFAGIGLWSLALRWAGWSDERKIWTGSCPCQPFSAAGRGDGFADERHLWPAWEWLVAQRKPRTILGEQVGSPAGLVWLDLVCADLEDLGYRVGAVDLPSAGVGAPNIRQRLWWVADTQEQQRPADGVKRGAETGPDRGTIGGIDRQVGTDGGPGGPPDPWGLLEWIGCLDGRQRPTEPGLFPLAARHPGDVAKLRAYGNAVNPVVAAHFIRAFIDIA